VFWFWFSLWFALVAAGVTILTLLGLHLWRKVKALTAEAGTAADRFAEVSAAITTRPAPPGTDSPARH